MILKVKIPNAAMQAICQHWSFCSSTPGHDYLSQLVHSILKDIEIKWRKKALDQRKQYTISLKTHEQIAIVFHLKRLHDLFEQNAMHYEAACTWQVWQPLHQHTITNPSQLAEIETLHIK